VFTLTNGGYATVDPAENKSGQVIAFANTGTPLDFGSTDLVKNGTFPVAAPAA